MNINSWTDEDLMFFLKTQSSKETFISALRMKVASVRNKVYNFVSSASGDVRPAEADYMLLEAGPITNQQIYDLVHGTIDSVSITDPFTSNVTTLTSDDVVEEVASQLETCNIIVEGFNACYSQASNNTSNFISEFGNLINYNVPNLTANGKSLVGAIASGIGGVAMDAVTRAKSLFSLILPQEDTISSMDDLTSNYSGYTYSSPFMAWVVSVDWSSIPAAISRVNDILGNCRRAICDGVVNIVQKFTKGVTNWVNSVGFNGYTSINNNYDVLTLDKGSFAGRFYLGSPIDSSYFDSFLRFDFGTAFVYLSNFSHVYDEDDEVIGEECDINIVPKFNKWLMNHSSDILNYSSLHDMFSNFTDEDWTDWYSQDLPDGFDIESGNSNYDLFKAAICGLALFNWSLQSIYLGAVDSTYGWTYQPYPNTQGGANILATLTPIYLRNDGSSVVGPSATNKNLYWDFINGYPDYTGSWGPFNGDDASHFFSGKLPTLYTIPAVGAGATWNVSEYQALSELLSFLLTQSVNVTRNSVFIVPYEPVAAIPLGAVHFYDNAELIGNYYQKMNTLGKVVTAVGAVIATVVITKKLRSAAIAASAKADLYYFSDDFDPDTQMDTYVRMARYAGFLETLAGLASSTTAKLVSLTTSSVSNIAAKTVSGLKSIITNSGSEADPTIPEDENLLTLILKTLKVWDN